MAETGSLSIYIALGLAAYVVIASVLGRLRSAPELVDSARNTTYVIPAVLGLAVVALVLAFLTRDFRLEYVAAHSNQAMDAIYTWVAFYAGNEGSLLYIAFALSLFAAGAVAWMPPSLKDSLPHTMAILMSVLVFFLLVMATLANPFDVLSPAPADGQGINPLLTHPGMFFHPPMLMAGLVSITVPFAVVMGRMMSGKVGDDWVDLGRVWSLVAWGVLGVGLLLGAWWAYTILGWGGYWAWDPIENVALMPWLALTAFAHSIMVQKRRGMFRMWNVVLMNIAFVLAMFGIFINRGGPVPSVHSFASSALGWVFLAFLGLSVLFSFGVFLWKYSDLKGMVALESLLSREAAFLLNNMLLLAITFVTLWGVVYPLVSQLVQGVEVTVAEPFYNQLNGPLMLALVFLMGVGPLLPWRHASWKTVRRAVQTPTLAATLVTGALALLGIHKPFALVAFGLVVLVMASILQEWTRGTRARHRRGENYVLAFLRLLSANRPRYGGYIVHISITMLALGVAGSSFYGVQRDVNLAPGESVDVSGYNVQYLGERIATRSDRTEFFNDLRVTLPSGKAMDLTAWRASYPAQRISSTRAAIRSTPLEDLYIVSSESLESGRVVFRILVNPLVWWMWLSGVVFVAGATFALWPRRGFSFAPAPKRRELTGALVRMQ